MRIKNAKFGSNLTPVWDVFSISFATKISSLEDIFVLCGHQQQQQQLYRRAYSGSRLPAAGQRLGQLPDAADQPDGPDDHKIFRNALSYRIDELLHHFTALFVRFPSILDLDAQVTVIIGTVVSRGCNSTR